MAITVERDIPFARVLRADGEVETLRLDLYLPEADALAHRPVIFWFHGGGFRAGADKQQTYIVSLASEFAARGYVGIAPDYRVRTDATLEWPAAVCDAVADARLALDWMRSHAAQHRMDAHRIVLAGGSAGGMIVHSLCHDPGALLDARRDGLCAAISLWGPPLPQARLFETVNPNCPPTLFIHGTADALVPYHLSPDLIAELRSAGVAAELLTLEGAAHTPVMHMAEIVDAISGFLRDRCA
jgi:acetyl esterase/lipase